MRERATLVGGRLEAGPRLGGGFAVRAWLPIGSRLDRGRPVSEPLRVLIADDQALVRGGFRMILEAQADIEVVGEAADGEAAVRCAADRPDVVLMDVRMPGWTGSRRPGGSLAARPASPDATRRRGSSS